MCKVWIKIIFTQFELGRNLNWTGTNDLVLVRSLKTIRSDFDSQFYRTNIIDLVLDSLKNWTNPACAPLLETSKSLGLGGSTTLAPILGKWTFMKSPHKNSLKSKIPILHDA